ncbi:MAG TPA: hypothetical protein ENF64_02330 [Hadesarchaea archaeon]|nr:hypothetical protein [Hadesarchaea archaeon]
MKPTEDRTKLETAVKKIFPTVSLELVGENLVGESTDVNALSRLHQLFRQQAILDSARSVLLAKRRENITQFMLNKQAAFVGRVSFTDGEAPLGPISVTLEAPDLDYLIDYLAPKTRDGKPIREVEYREKSQQ